MDQPDGKLNRRSFLAAAPLAAAAPAEAQDTLALEGGKPVRAARLPPAASPGAQCFDEQELKEVREVLEARSPFRWYGPGTPRKALTFEQEFAKAMGAKFALGVTSGTAALHCAMHAAGVGPGDEVILPAWGWYSCYNAVLLTGALPVFAESDESFNIDPQDIERKITPRTKAILVIHLWGCPADMDRVMAIARKHRLRVVEDCAWSVGGEYKGRRLGSIGDIGMYSFQIAKLITAGEGGAVVTNDPVLFERAARFHDLGMLRPGLQARVGEPSLLWLAGTNYRMNEMTAGVLCAQLRKLDTIIGAMRRNARSVREQIGNLPRLSLRQSPDPAGDVGMGVYILLETSQVRDRFAAALRAENVAAGPPSGAVMLPSAPYIEKKLAPHPGWPSFNDAPGKAMEYGPSCCPKTAAIFHRSAAVMIGPKFSPADADDIARAVRKVHRALIG